MEEIRVDQNGIANYKENFSNERNNFINQTYSTFNSSYITRCYDSKVSIMQRRLRDKYEKINHLYNAINNYLVEYTNCIQMTENALKNETNYTANSMVNSALYRLAELENFTPNLKHMTFVETSTFEYAKESITYTASSNAEIFNKVVSNAKSSIATEAAAEWANLKRFGSSALNVLLSAGANLSDAKNTEVLFAYNAFNNLKENSKDIGKDIQEKMAATASNISAFASDAWNNYAYYEQLNAQYTQETANAEWEALKKVGGTIATTGTSLIEGVGRFGESILDTISILGTIEQTGKTLIFDGCQAIYGAITGEEWHSKTKEMWNRTMSFVSEKHVETWFDNMYENTEYGQFLKNNSYGFETNRDISSGIGEVAGIVALSVLTFGVGGAALGGSAAAGTVTSAQMAAVAGASGFGKGAEKSWGEGAGVVEGLGYASLNAGWEALQYYLGGKIGGSNFLLPKEAEIPPTIKNKVLNSLSKIVLDTIDSGIEGFVQPMLNLTYKDGYTDANGTYHEFTEQDNIFTKYFNLFDENGGWNYVRTNAIIGGASSALGEGFDISKYFKDKIDIDVDDLDIETKTSIVEKLTNGYINDPTDADAIAKANYDTRNGAGMTFQFSDADKMPKIGDDFWRGFEHPERIYFNINGRVMNFDDAVSYKLNYDLNMKDTLNTTSKIDIDKIVQNNEHKMNSEIMDTVRELSPDAQNDPYAVARKLYIELNKRLHYSTEMTMAGEKYRTAIVDRLQGTPALSFNDFTGNEVLCKGWSELYSDLLKQVGLSENQVTILDDNQRHWWVRIDAGDAYILADATDSINHTNDLITSKSGGKTNGFMIVPKDYIGDNRPSHIVANKKNIDYIEYINNRLQKIDEKINYTSKNGYYYDEVLSKVNGLFGDNKIANFLAGTAVFNKKLQNYFTIDVPKDMNGFEAWGYFRKMKENLFTDSEAKNIVASVDYIIDPNTGKYISNCQVHYYDVDSGNFKGIIYNEIDGIKAFETKVDFDKELSNLHARGYEYDHNRIVNDPNNPSDITADLSKKDENTYIPDDMDATINYNEIGEVLITLPAFGDSVKNGADQHAIENLWKYEYNGEIYSLDEVHDIIKTAQENNTLCPRFVEVTSPEITYLTNKLMSQGYDESTAKIILQSIDNNGVCTYASFLNLMYTRFEDYQDTFKEIFGFPMYKEIDGEVKLNDAEFLMDFYTFVNDKKNGGSLLENNKIIALSDEFTPDGNHQINNDNQVFIFGQDGLNTDSIQKYFESKNISSKVVSDVFQHAPTDELDIEIVKKTLVEGMEKDYTFSLGVYDSEIAGHDININLLDENNQISRIESTASWEGGGHEMAILGVTESGVIVSTWGGKAFVSFEDLKAGEFDLTYIGFKN